MPMNAETRQRFEQEEQAYWQQREELLKRYKGKWVAIVGGQVVAVGDNSGAVIREAYQKTGSTAGFVAHVGCEDEVYRIRQVTTGHYDRAYHRPMPKVIASVRHLTDAASTDVDFVVDTGADLTVLRQDVADAVNLWNDAAGQIRVAGIGGAPELRQLYNTFVHVAGQDILITADCRDDTSEDILGRDVINEFALTVCAKREQVEFEGGRKRSPHEKIKANPCEDMLTSRPPMLDEKCEYRYR